MKVIVGLGNPGEKYAAARHNLGFMVVSTLADSLQESEASWEKSDKFQSETCQLLVGNSQILLVKPQTYMNQSGEAVKKLADFYKIPPEDFILIHDDLDLPLGKLKIQKGGGAAGHHGVESVIDSLKSSDFYRVRLGIETSPPAANPDRFVLEPFLLEEQPDLDKIITRGARAVETLISQGLEPAQRTFNTPAR